MTMVALVFVIPILTVLLWLFCIRPYSLRNAKGYTPGGNAWVTFWVDWQQAQEIAKAKNDRGILLICRVAFWLHLVFVVILIYSLFIPIPD